MNWLRLIGYGAALAAVVGCVSWALGTYRKAQAVDAYRACTAAAGTADKPLEKCDAVVGARIDVARRAVLCDASLKGRDLFAIRAACSAEAKQIVAERDAAAANLIDAQEQLRLAAADRDTAVARAELRAATTAERKATHDKVLRDAPRAADGRIHCDASCLRALAGQ